MKAFYASKTPKELRDFWGTPQPLWNRFDAEFNFYLDTAANEYNTKCPAYLTDGLCVDWALLIPEGRAAWNNPPFSCVSPWVDQAIQCAEHGRVAVQIVNSQTGAKWWHKAKDAATEVRMSKGRVAFIHPVTGKPVSGNNLGQTLFVYVPGRLGESKLASFNAK